MQNIDIIGFGSYLPPLVVTNNDLSKIIDTSDEWIESRTGIKERRISEGEDTSMIAAKAAKLALQRANIEAQDIDLIVLATVTPDTFTPSVACLVQKEIGAKNAMAFDINAACSGFVYGLQVAYSMMEYNKGFKKTLVIGAETLSKMLNWEDRSTCVLFGDGAGAVILSNEENDKKKSLAFYSRSEGEKGDALYAGALDVINPYVSKITEKHKKVTMNGKEVFKFASSAIVESINKVLEQSNLTLEDIDYIVPHQANCRIIEYAAKKMKVNLEKFYLNVDKMSNTSSASIPIALNEMYEKNMLSNGEKIILVGFGGGLTCGAVLIEL